MSGIVNTEHFVVAPDRTKLYVREKTPLDSGNGKVLLLLHGAGVDSRSFDCPLEGYSTMDFFAKEGYDVWAFDFRGFSFSDCPEDGRSVTVDVCADDTIFLTNYIRSIRSADRVSLIGASLGALVASVVAERKPELVSNVILLGFMYKKMQPAMMGGIPWDVLEASPSIPPMPELMAACMPSATKEVIDWNNYTFEGMNPSGPLLSIKELPVAKEPARITCPVLILNGDKEIFAVKEDVLDFLKAIAASKKEFVELEGLGHAAFMERPQKVYDEILRFIK